MGSSPLTRGKLENDAHSPGNGRLIPAHAGKTHPGTQPRGWRGAHPRSRGENSTGPPTRWAVRGSSPLTRGKLVRSAAMSRADRLIPAHAGKTACCSVAWTGPPAHPRSRGENIFQKPLSSSDRGSSPLTRGKRLDGTPEPQAYRLIPAHAGKTASDRKTKAPAPAHPRSRGENALGDRVGFQCGGSSPLTRGKRRDAARHGREHGLIPAHAGKTLIQSTKL